jgi:hypothetical protein
LRMCCGVEAVILGQSLAGASHGIRVKSTRLHWIESGLVKRQCPYGTNLSVKPERMQLLCRSEMHRVAERWTAEKSAGVSIAKIWCWFR